jgi:hypothetical protein
MESYDDAVGYWSLLHLTDEYFNYYLENKAVNEAEEDNIELWKLMRRAFLILKKIDPNIYTKGDFPKELKEKINKSGFKNIILVKDGKIKAPKKNFTTYGEFTGSPSEYVNGIFMYVESDRIKFGAIGQNSADSWYIEEDISYSYLAENKIVKMKGGFLSSTYYINLGSLDFFVTDPDEWKYLSPIAAFFEMFNSTSRCYDKQVKDQRTYFYNNTELGISDDILIRQIGAPKDWEVASKTKNSEKAYLYYDGFKNRVGNQKYKRRFEIKNGELNGIKDGEFDVKSGSKGNSYKVTFKAEEVTEEAEDTNANTVEEESSNDLEANTAFFIENKLTILKNGNLRDENFEEYELEEERGDFIVYKPEGMRGKKAYIKTDGENYLAWSGPIKIEHKSNFLRGDLDKVEEESQPIEEAPVQEKEVENIEAVVEVEQEQENESETTDSNMSLSERLNKLTKLYDEGILTKEELQKKTTELMS